MIPKINEIRERIAALLKELQALRKLLRIAQSLQDGNLDFRRGVINDRALGN